MKTQPNTNQDPHFDIITFHSQMRILWSEWRIAKSKES